uniref:COP1 E3 ubiquitin ligase n=1 Tax=Petromyzon marinus TaxID=7757 RepID=S4R572_PETMA
IFSPICFDMIEEAYITKCGHSFCCKCIRRSLEENNRCPKCNYVIENPNQIFPNFLCEFLPPLTTLRCVSTTGAPWEELLALDQDGLELADVNRMLELLTQKKMQLEAESTVAQHQLLIEFLQQAHRNKQGQLDQLSKELSVLHGDMRNNVSGYRGDLYFVVLDNDMKTRLLEDWKVILNNWFNNPDNMFGGLGLPLPCIYGQRSAGDFVYRQLENGKNPTRTTSPPPPHRRWQARLLSPCWLAGKAVTVPRRKKLSAHFDDLEQCYFTCRLSSPSGVRLRCRRGSDENKCGQLEEFQDCLAKFTRYSSVRPLATLSYASDIYNGSSIVSSIEFDRDCDYFAIAGVTKKIKVFEYGTVIRDAVDIHYPVIEMTCNSKISCISWSNYHKGILASSDYEGTVILWDGFTGQRTKVFQEHEKRCWSVDFNLMDPKILASGSDDAKVKLWSTHLDNSVACIEAKANVCCVKFSPTSRYHLAFGCADHCVHYYDLRNTKLPVMVFKGHRKAVSYAKFVSGEEIVSASTDSQLKLWSVNKPHCLRSFKGHINEKNFVGLATNGD